jgi:hypothetical protein
MSSPNRPATVAGQPGFSINSKAASKSSRVTINSQSLFGLSSAPRVITQSVMYSPSCSLADPSVENCNHRSVTMQGTANSPSFRFNLSCDLLMVEAYSIASLASNGHEIDRKTQSFLSADFLP